MILTSCNQILTGNGHSWEPTRNLSSNPKNIAFANEFWRSSRIGAAVCHGHARRVNVTNSEGKNILTGRVANDFSDAEDEKLGYTNTNDIPFALETRMKELDCKYEKAAELFGVKICVDGKLYTGPNPPSAKALGDEIVKALKVRLDWSSSRHALVAAGLPCDDLEALEMSCS